MSLSMERFAGRVAVVTGASSGIGAQIAEDLVRAGMVVVGVARRVDRLQAQAASLSGLRGRLEPLQADLSSTDELCRVFKWVDDNLGGISVLVNNAAIMPLVAIPDFDPADTAGHRILASPGLGSAVAYCASKHATVALTQGLRADLQALKASGFRIRVTSLSPGAVQTEMLPEGYRKSLPDADMALRVKDVSTAALYVLGSPPAVEITELTIQATGEFI
ncbi:hypothetical protein FOCC_FOCC001337 [Frankliniella occidentalis]|nr:hypothetical protein FOCC_FOCC001337 [Frankliniella occidentalis]